MTTEEEKSVIGGNVLEYAELKRQLINLDSKLQGALRTVKNIQEAVEKGHQNVVSMFDAWPTAEEFKNLLNEIQTKQALKDTLEKKLKGYGLDQP